MEIDANMTNMNWGAVNGLSPTIRAATGAKPVAGSDFFANSTTLETALKNTPDSRPEAVARGQAAVSNADYPSADMVKQLSAFLASKLQSSPD